MDITARKFLESKFGKDRQYLYDVSDTSSHGTREGGELEDILEEFLIISLAKNISQLKNPRTNEYVIVDKDKATIIGTFDKPLISAKQC